MDEEIEKYVREYLEQELREVTNSSRSSYLDNKDLETIEQKEKLNLLIIEFLKSILSQGMVQEREKKLTIINLLDELNFRNEIQHLMEKNNFKSVNSTSERLGKKFMSSVDK